MLPRTPQKRTEISATGKCPPGKTTSRRGHGRPTFRGDRKRIPTRNHDVHPLMRISRNHRTPAIFARRENPECEMDHTIGPRPGPGRATRRRHCAGCAESEVRTRFCGELVANFGCRSIMLYPALLRHYRTLPPSSSAQADDPVLRSGSIGHCGAAYFTGGDLLDCPLEF